MSYAPGVGPRLAIEQQFMLESIRRQAMTCSREALAAKMCQLQHQNMMLRMAIQELCDEEQAGS